MQVREIFIGSGLLAAAVCWGISAEVRIRGETSRIATLEEAVQLLSTAPAVSRAGEDGAIANPLLEACAGLITRAGALAENLELTAAQFVDRQWEAKCANVLPAMAPR